MYRRLRYITSLVTALAGFIALAGCASSTAAPQSQGRSGLPESDAPARAAGLDDQEIGAARKVYVTKCARCHKFYDPAQYDAKEWHTWMSKMSKKARLKPDQEEVLARYLDAFRASAKTSSQP
jgi:hypothetical protein